jgi:hypothetical protein
VHDDVDLAEGLFGRVEQGHHVRFFGDDGAYRERLLAVLGQLPYRCFRGYFVAGAAQHHGVAIRGQPVGDLLPDAARLRRAGCRQTCFS